MYECMYECTSYSALDEGAEGKAVGELCVVDDSLQQWRMRIMSIPQPAVAKIGFCSLIILT